MLAIGIMESSVLIGYDPAKIAIWLKLELAASIS